MDGDGDGDPHRIIISFSSNCWVNIPLCNMPHFLSIFIWGSSKFLVKKMTEIGGSFREQWGNVVSGHLLGPMTINLVRTLSNGG